MSKPSPGWHCNSWGEIFGSPNPASILAIMPPWVIMAQCSRSSRIISVMISRSALKMRSCTSLTLSPCGGRQSMPPLSHSLNSGFSTSSSADFPSNAPKSISIRLSTVWICTSGNRISAVSVQRRRGLLYTRATLGYWNSSIFPASSAAPLSESGKSVLPM